MTDPTLLPCPFCGDTVEEPGSGNAYTQIHGSIRDNWWYVNCGDCMATGGAAATKKLARELWNSREAPVNHDV